MNPLRRHCLDIIQAFFSALVATIHVFQFLILQSKQNIPLCHHSTALLGTVANTTESCTVCNCSSRPLCCLLLEHLPYIVDESVVTR